MSQFGHVCESKCNIMRSNKIIHSWLHALCGCKQTLLLGKFPRYHLLLKTRMSKSTAVACETEHRNIIFLPDKRYEMHQHKICKFLPRLIHLEYFYGDNVPQVSSQMLGLNHLFFASDLAFVFGFFLAQDQGYTLSLRCKVRWTLHELYHLYFSPQVMLKFIIKVTEHFLTSKRLNLHLTEWNPGYYSFACQHSLALFFSRVYRIASLKTVPVTFETLVEARPLNVSLNLSGLSYSSFFSCTHY